MNTSVMIEFEGDVIAARPGESLLAALTAAGKVRLRQTAKGTDRGAFCGMGVCYDCLVVVDEDSPQRACMTKVRGNMRVRRTREAQPPPATPAAAGPRLLDDVPVERPEVLVIGAGPAGLAAAIAAAESGARVLVLDERESPGGQYFKQPDIEGFTPGPDRQHREGAALIARARAAGAELRGCATIWGAFAPHEFAATVGERLIHLKPQATIIATGAYERAWPVPGWTRPGVITTGAAQTMWRTARRLPGRRVLIAGNGPLNLQLAAELLTGGAEIVALVEAAARPRDPVATAQMLALSPGLVAQGLGYLRACRKAAVPIRYGEVLTQVASENDMLVATTSSGARHAADAVCLGYGFHPSAELARALGCDHRWDPGRGQLVPVRDADGCSSLPDVYIVGDGAGLGGARVALAQGRLAGFAAASSLGLPVDRALLGWTRTELARHRGFQRALWRLYRPARPMPQIDPDTVLCRCEEVRLATVQPMIESGAPIGAIKQRHRVGMGRCQGRYCTPMLEALVETAGGPPRGPMSGFAPRVPVKPVRIADLAR